MKKLKLVSFLLLTFWGCKYLALIKRDGKWKITSVIYSLEYTEYFSQPSLKKRQKQKNSVR